MLKAVCDLDPQRADQMASSFDAKAYYDISDMLKQEETLQVLAVCTPNGCHAGHSISALQSGLHVLCEKPLCLSVAEGKKMMEAAAANSRNLFVVKSTRYNPALAALKKLLEQDALGKIYSFQINCLWNRPLSYYQNSWHGTPLDGGTLFTQFSHYLDAMLWLFGDVKNISGFRKNQAHAGVILSEDSGMLAMEMCSGVLGGLHWSVNTFRENMEVSLTLIAEKGHIRIGGGYMNEVTCQVMNGINFPETERGTANQYGAYTGSMSNHEQVYENLILALTDPKHPFTHAADGLKTVELIERIYATVSLS